MENQEQKGITGRIYDWFRNFTLIRLFDAILAIFVVIIILFAVSYLPSVMSRISSSLSAALYSVFIPANSATMTADKSLMNSGEDFTVTFKKADTTSTTSGLFTVSYACDANPNVSLVAVETTGLKKIDCDTPYYLLGNGTSLKIRPTTQDSVVRLVLTGAFENNDTQKTDTVGVVRVTIKNDAVGTITTSTAATVSKTPVYTAPASTYSGTPDLAARILQVGLLNGNSLTTTQNQFSSSDMVGVRFEVRNDGDADTGMWYFTATLPSISTPTYSSNTQTSLKPGESIIFTLGFTNLTNQNISTITINVDPQNTVTETSEANNIVTTTITNLSYYNNNNYYNNSTNGCYINGIYTYNCNNNYNYNNGWNYNYTSDNNLTASCYASKNNPQIGETVSWSPIISGGNGSYSYYWTGTDGLSSYGQYPSMAYYTAGYKVANLTVSSGGYSTTVTCSTNVGNINSNYNYNSNGYYDSYGNFISYNNNYNSNYNSNLGVTCYGVPNNAGVGEQVYWYAAPAGGNGAYSYSWSGTDGLNSTSRTPSTITYNYSGTKTAVVTVGSNGYHVSNSCSVYVN